MIAPIQFLLCIFMVISYSAFSFAKGPANISVGLGKLSGDTTYRIGGLNTYSGVTDSGVEFYGHQVQRDPTSELEFPMDVKMISIQGSEAFGKRFKLSAGLKKDISDDAGKMKDSDWGVWYSYTRDDEFWANDPTKWWPDPNSLDIYSESDATLSAVIMDINLQVNIARVSNWLFNGGIGYIYQNFDYDVRNTVQWSPSSPALHYRYLGAYSIVTDRKTLTYEVTYTIPFIEGGVQYTNERFSVSATIGYSPIVTAKDKDVHIAAGSISKGDCDGHAFLFSLEGEYYFTHQFFIAVNISQTDIDTDGKDSYIYREYISSLNEYADITGKIGRDIESKQTYYSLSVGYSF